MTTSIETKMRRFVIHCEDDKTGLTVTGVISQGVVFDTGKCVVTFIKSPFKTISIHDNIDSVINIMCSNSKYTIIWLDPDPYVSRCRNDLNSF